MLNLQLYIYNAEEEVYQQVELYDDESVTITQSLQDVKDIQKVFTDFSRTFSVPASKNNNKIFQHYYNYHIDGFDAQSRTPAQIYLNHKFYKSGYIKLEAATLIDNKAHTYKVTFFGSGVVLKDIFTDKKLSSLALLDKEFKFDYSSANILTYLQSGLDITYLEDNIAIEGQESVNNEITIEDAFVVPLITHTKRPLYDTDSNVTNNDARINLHNGTDKGLELSQLKPAIKLRALIKAIEHQYRDRGIVFSEDFFNADNDVFDNLYMWMHSKSGELFAEQAEQIPLEFTSGSVTSLNGRNNAGVVDVKDGYVVNPKPGQVGTKRGNKFRRVIAKITAPSDTEYDFVIKSNGNLYFRSTLSGSDETTTEVAYIPHGDITFHIESTAVGTFNASIRIERNALLTGVRHITFDATAVAGATKKIVPTQQLPDMKIIDFLTGIFKLFNLTAYVNREDKIVIQSLDQFYRASGKIYDITEYIDKNNATVQSTLPFKNVSFKYKGSESFLAKNHKDQFGYEWGSTSTENENIGTETEKFVGEEYNIEVPFEHFKYEKLETVDINVGWSVDSKRESYIGEPLLFYAVSQETSADIKYINFDDTTGTIASGTSIFMPSNSLEVGVEDSANLNFNAEKNEFDNTPYFKTLFQEYYKNYITEIFDKQRRITNTQAYLPLSILMNLQLNDVLKISDSIFKINTITTNYQTLLSKLELINTQNVVGRLMTTDLNLSLAQQGGLCTTADTEDFFASNVILKADCKAFEDGYVVDNSDAFEADKNTPDTSEDGVNPVTVTAATIFDPHVTADSILVKSDSDKQRADEILREVTASSFKIGYQITELGKIGDSRNIDEYGFLYSTTETDMQGKDIDVIAAKAGVTKINYPTASNNKRPSTPFISSYQKNDATSSTSYYFRFYARTNTNINYQEADILSGIEEIETS